MWIFHPLYTWSLPLQDSACRPLHFLSDNFPFPSDKSYLMLAFSLLSLDFQKLGVEGPAPFNNHSVTSRHKTYTHAYSFLMLGSNNCSSQKVFSGIEGWGDEKSLSAEQLWSQPAGNKSNKQKLVAFLGKKKRPQTIWVSFCVIYFLSTRPYQRILFND